MGKTRPKRIILGLATELASGGKSYAGTIANFSENGLGVYVETTSTENILDCPPGTTLELKFQPPSGETLNLHCEVRWLHTYKNPPHGSTSSIGIKIIDPPLKYKEFFKTLETSGLSPI